MIRHIVMFKVKENNMNQNKEQILGTAKLMVQNFEEEIPVIRKFTCVTNSMEAPDSNYDLALICDFNSIEDLNEYQKHPKHLEFGEFIVSVRESRACIDYEI